MGRRMLIRSFALLCYRDVTGSVCLWSSNSSVFHCQLVYFW